MQARDRGGWGNKAWQTSGEQQQGLLRCFLISNGLVFLLAKLSCPGLVGTAGLFLSVPQPVRTELLTQALPGKLWGVDQQRFSRLRLSTICSRTHPSRHDCEPFLQMKYLVRDTCEGHA